MDVESEEATTCSQVGSGYKSSVIDVVFGVGSQFSRNAWLNPTGRLTATAVIIPTTVGSRRITRITPAPWARLADEGRINDCTPFLVRNKIGISTRVRIDVRGSMSTIIAIDAAGQVPTVPSNCSACGSLLLQWFCPNPHCLQKLIAICGRWLRSLGICGIGRMSLEWLFSEGKLRGPASLYGICSIDFRGCPMFNNRMGGINAGKNMDAISLLHQPEARKIQLEEVLKSLALIPAQEPWKPSGLRYLQRVALVARAARSLEGLQDSTRLALDLTRLGVDDAEKLASEVCRITRARRKMLADLQDIGIEVVPSPPLPSR